MVSLFDQDGAIIKTFPDIEQLPDREESDEPQAAAESFIGKVGAFVWWFYLNIFWWFFLFNDSYHHLYEDFIFDDVFLYVI